MSSRQEPESPGVLVPLSAHRRKRSWEAAGLFDLIAGVEAGEVPPEDDAAE